MFIEHKRVAFIESAEGYKRSEKCKIVFNLGCQNRKSFSSGGVALKGSSKPIHYFLFNNVAVSILLLSPLPCKDCTSGPRGGGGRGRRGLGDLFVCKDRHNIGIKNGTGTFL